MLGPAQPRDLGRPVVMSLDGLVPPDHVSRHLDERLDLGFVREWVRDAYSDRGRPSIDPVVFFKLYLVMFFEGIRSERQLLALAADCLSVRWYLGYALDEALPNASGFTRIRQRLGLAVFRRFCERVVDLCQEAVSSGAGGLRRRDPSPRQRLHRFPRDSLSDIVDGQLVALFGDDVDADGAAGATRSF
jgi:transposase